jgi:hypothetical protein
METAAVDVTIGDSRKTRPVAGGARELIRRLLGSEAPALHDGNLRGRPSRQFLLRLTARLCPGTQQVLSG